VLELCWVDANQSLTAIEVGDAGRSIPDSELESIFDKFVQSSKTDNGAGGTGLGLTICREIIHAHKGFIYALNNAFGAAFVVLLPNTSLIQPQEKPLPCHNEYLPSTTTHAT
jgi:signal transduction histidine kinase